MTKSGSQYGVQNVRTSIRKLRTLGVCGEGDMAGSMKLHRGGGSMEYKMYGVQ